MNALDFSVVVDAIPFLLKGLRFSLMLTVAACAIGLVFGTVLALIQHLRVPLLWRAARVYIALMRSLPLILVLFWFFFLIPVIVGQITGSGRPVPIGPVWTAFITFGLFEAAYYSEIIRVGLRSIPDGQFEAAEALGLSKFKTYRLVILPQLARIVSPIVLSQTIILFQDTSLVYVLSLTDLLGAASKIAQLNGALVELYLVVALIYLVICFAASQAVSSLRRRVEMRLNKGST